MWRALFFRTPSCVRLVYEIQEANMGQHQWVHCSIQGHNVTLEVLAAQMTKLSDHCHLTRALLVSRAPAIRRNRTASGLSGC